MDFLTCLRERRSVRKFKTNKVSNEILTELVQAASYSPSWKNSQSVRYIAVVDEAVKKDIAENCTGGFAPNRATIDNAPALVLVTTVSPRSGFERDGSPSTSKGSHWESFDAGIAAQSFCLAAHAMGLGTVIQGYFDEGKLIQKANVPEGQKVSALIVLGYPDESPAMPKRKGVDDLLTVI